MPLVASATITGKVTRRHTDAIGNTEIVVDPTPGSPGSGDEVTVNCQATYPSAWDDYIDDSYSSSSPNIITITANYDPGGSSPPNKVNSLQNP